MTRRKKKALYVTLRNKGRLLRLAWHYMSKGRLYQEKMAEAYETLTGEARRMREMRIDVVGFDRIPTGVLPPDDDAWWRYVHDYYRHLAYDCFKISQQLFMSMSWFAGPECQGVVQAVGDLQVEYAHDPQCLLLRTQAQERLRRILTSSPAAIEETRACFAALRRVQEERNLRRRQRTPRCPTCSAGFGPRPRRCEEGARLSARARQAYQRADRLIGGPRADLMAAWAEYEESRLDVIEHDRGRRE